MQAFKLVNAGFVDRVIVFDELPKRLMQGIKTRDVSGFPRSWARWLADIDSTRPVLKTETTQNHDRSYTFKYTPIGKEPCFYILEYVDINADKEKWNQICEYLRVNLGPDVRIKEKIEDMALRLAKDSTSSIDVEPEDIPVIPVPRETLKESSPDEIVKPGETIIVEEQPQKKRGRPRKVAVEA